MNTFIIPEKISTETIVCVVPFSDVLATFSSSETISSFTIIVSVFSGIDPNPSAVSLGGSTDVTNTILYVTLTGGVSGVVYLISATVTGSAGSVVVKQGYLSVIPINPY